ncbi:MAG: glycosyltransferase family protein [Clostridium sp.]|nr:glycosyltransferase family protein [Clostridium sp.]
MNIICIVQARMGSERLPGKVIKPILNKPMVLYTLERLNRSKYIDKIILATSNRDIEKPLVNIVKNSGFEAFLGDEADVLKRYKEASDKYNGDIIIRVTGDCPLIDWTITDNVISHFLMYNYNYVRLDVPDSFVRGFDVEVFSKSALDKVYECTEDLDDMYREHVTLYMYRHPEQFKIGYVKGDPFYSKDYRLCVDTKEDFRLVSNIYGHFKDEFVPAKEIIKYLDNNKNAAAINSVISQKEV